MIITYSWLDQYKQIGFDISPDWFGRIPIIIPVTPTIRTAVIPYEDRTITITHENRAIVIPYENRTAVIS